MFFKIKNDNLYLFFKLKLIFSFKINYFYLINFYLLKKNKF